MSEDERALMILYPELLLKVCTFYLLIGFLIFLVLFLAFLRIFFLNFFRDSSSLSESMFAIASIVSAKRKEIIERKTQLLTSDINERKPYC